MIQLKLATDRDDKGKTDNYRIYAGGGTITAKNRKGENVQKNAVLGGNGTVYMANELVGEETELFILTGSEYRKLTGAEKQPSKTTPARGRK